jgi:hypothetical protein
MCSAQRGKPFPLEGSASLCLCGEIFLLGNYIDGNRGRDGKR